MSDLMQSADLARLKTDFGKLAARDQDFARSLIDQSARRGLSDKQWAWVTRLAQRLDQPADAAEPVARNLGSTTALRAMFQTATDAGLKFPHLYIRLDAIGGTAKLWVAGPNAKKPGSFSLTMGVAREWLGRVLADGTWEPSSKGRPELYASVADVLSRLMADPVATLADLGKQAGACCYCGIELTDARSVDVGYGPVCARKWGLPWGKPAVIAGK